MPERHGSVPAAYIVIGSAGSGKSHIARYIAREAGAAYLDKDVLVTPLTELLLRERGEDRLQRENNPYYRSVVFPAEYAALMATAGSNLAVGRPVVIDAPFFAYLDEPDYLVNARAAAGWPASRVVVIHVRSSECVIRMRLEARSLPRDRWKLDNWAEYWAGMVPLGCAWTGALRLEICNDQDGLDVKALTEAVDAVVDS